MGLPNTIEELEARFWQEKDNSQRLAREETIRAEVWADAARISQSVVDVEARFRLEQNEAQQRAKEATMRADVWAVAASWASHVREEDEMMKAADAAAISVAAKLIGLGG